MMQNEWIFLLEKMGILRMYKNLKISESVHKMLAIEARIQDKQIREFADELIIKALANDAKERLKNEERKVKTE